MNFPGIWHTGIITEGTTILEGIDELVSADWLVEYSGSGRFDSITDANCRRRGRKISNLVEVRFVTAQAEKRSVIKGEMTVGGKWADIRRVDFHVN